MLIIRATENQLARECGERKGRDATSNVGRETWAWGRNGEREAEVYQG